MTSNRNPDRLIRAWLELMPDEAPDRAIASVLQAIESTPQLRRPLVPALRRFTQMNRLPYAAAAAAIIAVIAGGVLLLRPSFNSGGPPIPSPVQPSPVQSVTPALAPESLRSTWLADAGPAASPGSPSSLVRLVISAAGDKVSVFDAGVETLISSPVANQTGELQLISTGTSGGCQIGDLGRYGFAFASDGTLPGTDGTLLGLTVVSDACSARSATLNRSWAHAIDANSHGGRGVAAAFSPMFLITLPPATFIGTVGFDSVTAESTSQGRTMYAVHNPIGWADPCSSKGGSKRPIDPTIAAFTAYLRTLPGFTVQSSDLTIDGHPAVLLTIPSVSTTDCPTHRVNEWTSSNPADVGGWLLNQGETDVLYLVEVDANLILFQWLGEGVTTEEEKALFATVRFTNTLPQ